LQLEGPAHSRTQKESIAKFWGYAWEEYEQVLNICPTADDPTISPLQRRSGEKQQPQSAHSAPPREGANKGTDTDAAVTARESTNATTDAAVTARESSTIATTDTRKGPTIAAAARRTIDRSAGSS
jgi:hypothetical protein